MTVAELIQRLEDYDPEARVLLAHQPSWPLQFDLQGLVAADELEEEEDDYDEDDGPGPDHDTRGQEPDAEEAIPVVYIVEGGHPHDLSPYAPRGCWERF